MSLPIYVDAYSGYKSNERPLRFELDDRSYEIAAVEDRWQEPNHEYFKVRTVDGKTYLLRYDERRDQWTLQSGFDGNELLARPGIELLPVDGKTIQEAVRRIVGCERCCGEKARLPFDWIVADVLDKEGAVEFFLTEQAKCPKCHGTLSEKTFIEPRGRSK
jgi:hypothetical protein